MGGIYIPWLVDAARLTGYPVVEVNGWRTRGHGGFRAVEGVVLHHTADGPGEYPSLNIVTNGRSDLAGPLCNLGIGRSGTIYVVAAGAAWHAGASAWAGFTDLNDEFIGIEAESRGTQDDWTPEERDCYVRLVAALLYYLHRDASRACGHLECALPHGRKIDPAFIDLNRFREDVQRLLADPLRLIPRGPAVAMSRADVLTDHGMLRAPEVVELADAAGLDLAAAATMLVMETGDRHAVAGGGQNIWGHDRVTVAEGTYTPGGPVTPENYAAYHAAVLAGVAGRQGVGPCQLTYWALQDEADAIGGTWDWRTNVTVGFRHLAGLIRARGLQGGFTAYNGQDIYGVQAMPVYETWKARLAGAVREEDDMAQVPQEEWQQLLDMTRQMLELNKWMWSQFAGENAAPFEFTGWAPLPGGHGDPRTLVDYGRTADEQLEDLKRGVAELRGAVLALPGAPAV